MAAASAIALYYLNRDSGAIRTRTEPNKVRPELLLMGATDHVELGSTIRSAAALGWNRALVDDRRGVWFGCDRVVRSEGRGAARRGRNTIRLVPVDEGQRFDFESACVVMTAEHGEPLHCAHLARGPRQVIVIPDEEGVSQDSEDWQRLARQVSFVHLDLPVYEFAYHYRLIASIALAEAARQVGRRPARVKAERWRRPAFYESALRTLWADRGEDIALADLVEF